MESFVLEGHLQDSSNTPGELALSRVEVVIYRHEAGPNSVTVLQYVSKRRPVLVPLRNFRVGVAMVRIVDVRIDTALEDLGITARIRVRLFE